MSYTPCRSPFVFMKKVFPNTLLGFFPSKSDLYLFFFVAEEAVKCRSTYGYCNLNRTKKRPRRGSIQHPGLQMPGKQMGPSARCGTFRWERLRDLCTAVPPQWLTSHRGIGVRRAALVTRGNDSAISGGICCKRELCI